MATKQNPARIRMKRHCEMVRILVFRRRSGFTLIELLACVGIVAFVLAMLMPAVLNTREAARRSECGNRLRQFGIAMHAFESANQRFPKSALRELTVNSSDSDLRAQKLCSFHYYLLPYLDLADLSNAIVLDGDVWSCAPIGFPTSSKNNWLVYRSVPAFCCPSDRVPLGATSYRCCDGTTAGGGTTPDVPPPNSSLHGFTRSGSGVRASQVSDGLANTVMFSERLVGGQDSSRYDPARDVALVEKIGVWAWTLPDETIAACGRISRPVQFNAYSGMGWIFYGCGTTVYNHISGPNSRLPDCAQGSFVSPGTFAARSFHNGGVNVCMGDGSVRFAAQEIDISVWRAASTIDGAEGVQLP